MSDNRNKNNNISNNAFHFFDIWLLVNIILKTAGVVDWSWKFTLLPLWITIGILIVVLLFYGFSLWLLNK